MFGMSRYNYERFDKATLLKDFTKSQFGSSAPEPGDSAPDFTLRTVNGDKVTLSDFEDDKNVVLTFGSATCPQTAASIGGLQDLHEEFGDQVQFLFVYVREAHPGGELPAHSSMSDKVRAAELLRDEEHIEFPILVDEVSGKVHKKYGQLPNPTYLIDKSGKIAFRSLGSRQSTLREAIEELLHVQEESDTDHKVVAGGQDTGLPPLRTMLHAHRALERGGSESINNFREQMGIPRVALAAGRVARPVVEHPMSALAVVGASAGVIALGLWAGTELRKRRFSGRTPYDVYNRSERNMRDDYAVGI